MGENSLDRHLKEYCDQNPEYKNLYSTWNLNQRTCTDALQNVLMNYPHFSMHDASHSRTILSNLEMLLGNRVQKLSPTDTWLILHAAFAHDLGMIVRWDEIESVWSSVEFQEYLQELENGNNQELQEAALWIKNIKENSTDLTWPLRTERYIKLINASWFRGQHAGKSEDYLDGLGKKLKTDLGHSGLIKPRLLKLLGRICGLHTEPIENVLNLEFETDGYGSDYAHPRFIAMLLRLGDLLDIDNGRFNDVSELVAGPLPGSSVPHREKHDATTHILITPAEIQFSSDCNSSEAYLETQRFISWLEKEIDFFTKYWVKITPCEIGGFAPRFDKKNLYINGVKDLEGVEGLKFEISQEKAFQIIEGSNIYKDPFVFVREIIQNAMDASKLQLWKDLCSGTYQAWLDKDVEISNIQPYEIDTKIYENYPIEVQLDTLSNGETTISVRDRGTGITVDGFKHMCQVGQSKEGFKKVQDEIKKMPAWLRPTAGFGIGLQSIFLITDEFELLTHTGNECYKAVFHSLRKGGYVQLQKSNEISQRGTVLKIAFKRPNNITYEMRGATDQYLSTDYDPIGEQNKTGEVKVIEVINKNCKSSFFPIRLKSGVFPIQKDDIDTLPVARKIKGSGWTEADSYCFHLTPDFNQMEIWDKTNFVYGKLQLGRKMRFDQSILFKGIRLHETGMPQGNDWILVQIDIYGMEAKTAITLDRESMTETGRSAIYTICEEMTAFYKKQVLKFLEKKEVEKIGETKKFNLYKFWLACNAVEKKKINQDFLRNNIEGKAEILKKENDKWYWDEIDVNELIPFTEKTCFISASVINGFHYYDKFGLHDKKSLECLEKINMVLRKSVDAGMKIPDIIVADYNLWMTTKNYTLSKIIYMGSYSPQLLYYFSPETNKFCLSVDKDTKEELLKGLGQCILENELYGASTEFKRYQIPSIEGYEEISVRWCPTGIGGPTFSGVASIIAPFTRQMVKKRKNLTKYAFVEEVMKDASFEKLVEYVQEHPADQEKKGKKIIRGKYKQLIEEYYDIMRKEDQKISTDS